MIYIPAPGDVCHWDKDFMPTRLWRVTDDIAGHGDGMAIVIAITDPSIKIWARNDQLRPTAQTRLRHRRRPCL